jgi:hypothetical protein
MRIWLVILENEAETQRPWYVALLVFLDSISSSVVKEKRGGNPWKSFI